MKRKFFNSLLLLTAFVAAMSVFVSCNDYDDDINDLRNQISTTSTDLQSLVTDKINTVNNEITNLQTQAAALEAAYKAADEALQATLEASISSAASGAITTAEAYADIQAAEAQTAAIAAAQELVDNAVANLQVQLDAANSALEDVTDNVAALVAANTDLEEGIAAAQADATTALELIEGLQGEVEGIETAVTGLQGSVETLEGTVSALQGDVASALQQASDNAADILALDVELNQLKEDNEAAIAALDQALSDSCEVLKGLIAANQEAIEKALEEEVAALENEIAAALTAAKAYADAVGDAVAASLEKEIEGVNASIEAVKTAYAAADKDLQDNIDALSDELTATAATLQANIDAVSKALVDYKAEMEEALKAYATTKDLEALQATLEAEISEEVAAALAEVAATYATIEDVASLEAALTSLQGVVTTLETAVQGNSDAIAALQTTVEAQATAIAALQADVATINKYLGMEMKRLKSLVFAPTTYFNGIECIKFSTLSYTDWGENLYVDGAPFNGTEITVSDDSHTEEYLVSPSNVTRASIASLSFVANIATEVGTRAVSSDAPIAVAADTIGKNENGETVLKLNLKKTNTESFGMDPNEFTIVSLKAVIAEDFMTDEEIAAGEEVAVYSDWARLCETSATPYIHNAQAVDENGKLSEEEKGISHFWAFSDIYGKGGDVTTTIVAPDDIKSFIISVIRTEAEETAGYGKYLDYRETLDLSAYSIICDKEGNTYDPAAYGFSFEYNVVPCLVGDETSSVDQSLYASITDNVLTPTAADGTAFSTEAINKTPVIQVVLKDDNNGAVVDVRYFVIKIYDKDAQKDFGPLDTDTLEYVCGGMALVDGDVPAIPEKSRGYTMDVSSYIVQQLCAEYDMTEEVFFETYTELTGLYASEEEAGKVLDLNGGDAETDPRLGSIEMNDDHSLTWTIYHSDGLLEATQTDYANGYMEVHAWAVFANATAENIVTFELTMRLEIDKLALADNVNKNQSYWTTSGKLVFNPELETDAVYGNENYTTTMMIGNLLEGYLITTETSASVPTSTLDLVNKGDEATFVFDQDKFLAEVPAATETVATDWTFSADGTSVYYQGVPAATIITETSGKCYVQLYEGESSVGNPGNPTEGAKLLVDIDLPIVLVDEWCALSDSVDAYYIAFLKPLELNSTTDTIPITLTDVQAGGSNSGVQLDNTIQLIESAAVNHRVVWDNYTPTQAVEGLADWYGVEEPVYDLDNALTDLQLDGKLGTECKVPLSSFTKVNEVTGENEPIYRLEYDEENNQIVFYNDSGSALSQTIHILVDVKIATKWQDEIATHLLITVEPGHARTVKHQ